MTSQPEYTTILYTWASATAWYVLATDLAMGTIELSIDGTRLAMEFSARDTDRVNLYQWCIGLDDVN